MSRRADQFQILSLEQADVAHLDQVEKLFAQLYATLDEFGMLVPLAPDGPARWRAGLEPGLGRIGVLVVAVGPHERVVGFIQTVLALMAGFFGGGRTAKILNVFVAPEGRGLGLTTRMIAATEEWVIARGAKSIEVQTQHENSRAMGVYEHFGFRRELIQLRKLLGDRP